jgi:hypothetical protein
VGTGIIAWSVCVVLSRAISCSSCFLQVEAAPYPIAVLGCLGLRVPELQIALQCAVQKRCTPAGHGTLRRSLSSFHHSLTACAHPQPGSYAPSVGFTLG